MTGHDFLTLATTLAAGATEAEWRSAVSRAYYAAFHVVRDWFRDLGFVVPQADVAHKYLAYRLQNCGNPQLRQAGIDLDALRQARNEADYDLSSLYPSTCVKPYLVLAQRLLQAIPAAGVEPTRTQVRDAIIDYERTVLGQVTWNPPP
jgi:hypothetical protein